MSDRELLEMAAKAAGIMWYGYCGDDSTECHYFDIGPDEVVKWNPLRDDGDALRLAGTAGISVDRTSNRCWAWKNGSAMYGVCEEFYKGDIHAATRLAIVRAAAEIGRKMP